MCMHVVCVCVHACVCVCVCMHSCMWVCVLLVNFFLAPYPWKMVGYVKLRMDSTYCKLIKNIVVIIIITTGTYTSYSN